MVIENKPDWRQIGDWYQKTTVTRSGERRYTYYYKAKSAKPSKIFILNSKKANQLKAYHAIEKDIKDTQVVLGEYNRLSEKITSGQLNSDEIYKKKIILKGLMQSIVITYGKCFVTAGGRGTKLEEKEIVFKNRSYHKEIMSIRHQYIAHAGKSSCEKSRIICPLSSEKKLKQKKVVSIILFSEVIKMLSYEWFPVQMTDLLETVLTHVRNKINTLSNFLIEEIEKIPSDQLENLIRLNKRKMETPLYLEKEKIKNQRTVDKFKKGNVTRMTELCGGASGGI